MEAASGGHVEVARALLDHGAGVNTHSNDWKDSKIIINNLQSPIILPFDRKWK